MKYVYEISLFKEVKNIADSKTFSRDIIDWFINKIDKWHILSYTLDYEEIPDEPDRAIANMVVWQELDKIKSTYTAQVEIQKWILANKYNIVKYNLQEQAEEPIPEEAPPEQQPPQEEVQPQTEN